MFNTTASAASISHLHAGGHGGALPHGDAPAVALSEEVMADVLRKGSLPDAAAHQQREHGTALHQPLPGYLLQPERVSGRNKRRHSETEREKKRRRERKREGVERRTTRKYRWKNVPAGTLSRWKTTTSNSNGPDFLEKAGISKAEAAPKYSRTVSNQPAGGHAWCPFWQHHKIVPRPLNETGKYPKPKHKKQRGPPQNRRK